MSRQTLRECHVRLSENVKSTAQRECHVSKSATWMIGRGLSLFTETSVSSRLGACVLPRPRALTKSQSQRMVGPLEGSKEGSQQIDHLRHRQVKASPVGGVARLRHRQAKTSQGGFGPRQFRTVTEEGGRWLQGHKF